MKFKYLPDGTKFRITQDMEAGMDVVYVKALEDGPYHNAVRTDNSSLAIRIDDNVRVVPIL
ncbi:hypothetical protein MIF8_40 [Erwinia phage MIF8]